MTNILLQKFKRDLILKGYSQQTQKTYFRNLEYFLNYISRNPLEVEKEHIKDYLYHIIGEKNLSESSLRQARGAIKYFFSQTLQKPMEVENIPCYKKSKRIPSVLTVDEVFHIIHCAANMKHKTMLMLAYSSGLRVSEISKLKVNDIKRKSMRLTVHQGKGRQDRYTILSEICLKQLEEYWQRYRPQEWLFYGRKGANISIRSIQRAFTNAKRKACITKEGGIHTLRHSFATHMLEGGGGIFQLQKFLGHKNLKTTLVYAHITEENIIARSPLDIYADKYRESRTLYK